MTNKERFEAAKGAIANLFGDTTVSRAKTMEQLETLASDIEENIEALRADERMELRREGEG